MNLDIVDQMEAHRWLEILGECVRYDFFHCPSYHEISVHGKDHRSKLLAYREGEYLVAIPFVIRPLSELECLDSFAGSDATSVYGFVGPVASHDTIPERVIENFHANMNDYFMENNIVCAFSSLHPLLDQEPLLKGLGNIVHAGQTISIDLKIPVDEQYALFRRNHKDGIKKLRRLGASCKHDNQTEIVEQFVDIYHENMSRVNARDSYFFDSAYFHKIMAAKEFEMHLFTCYIDDEMACGGLFSFCKGIVQAFLAATKDKYLKVAPMKLLMDEARIWANEIGADFFHLGGGRGAEEDSLFKFKAGFSDTVHPFKLWQLVVKNEEYMDICKKKDLWNESKNQEPINGNYFPSYRCPTT